MKIKTPFLYLFHICFSLFILYVFRFLGFFGGELNISGLLNWDAGWIFNLVKNGPNSVSVANLGDSGVALFRDDKLVWESSQQEYLFNYPYQLSSDVDALPKDADRHVLTKLKSGDIIILATDGLWDNLYNKEIIKYLDDDSEVEDIATTLAVSAFHASNDQKRWGPFSQASVENLYTASPYASDEDFIPPPAPLTEYMGGKPDDITVIVGRLV